LFQISNAADGSTGHTYLLTAIGGLGNDPVVLDTTPTALNTSHLEIDVQAGTLPIQRTREPTQILGAQGATFSLGFLFLRQDRVPLLDQRSDLIGTALALKRLTRDGEILLAFSQAIAGTESQQANENNGNP
jgi:hypothetical protein